MTPSDIQDQTERETYILRTWRDQTLRGQIQHVRTGMTYPLYDLELLMTFIQKQIDKADTEKQPSSLK